MKRITTLLLVLVLCHLTKAQSSFNAGFQLDRYRRCPSLVENHVILKCVDGQPGGKQDIDANGNGSVSLSCAGNIQKQMTCRNWIVTGDFAGIGMVGGVVRGQFDNGTPVGEWTFPANGGRYATIDLGRDGTGYWAIPSADPTCGYYGFDETGQLVHGLREGVWQSRIRCHKVLEGHYWHGKKNGIWRVSVEDMLRASVTYLDDMENGPFVLSNGYLTIMGELKDGNGAFDALERGAFPSGPDKGKLWGTWRFFSVRNGFPLGESNLADGNGHLVVFSSNGDGAISIEGDVVNGLAQNLWTFHDDNGGIRQAQYEKGLIVSGSAISYPGPQVVYSPFSVRAPVAPILPAKSPVSNSAPAFEPRSCRIPSHDAFCGLIAQPAHVGCQITCNDPVRPNPVCQPEVCQNGNQFNYPVCYCK